MSTLRAAVTFLILTTVVVLSIFQMQIRGYDQVARIQGFVLYINDSEVCENLTYVEDGVTYEITCSSQYLLKSGFSEYSIQDALDEGYITLSDLNDIVDITIE